MSEGVTAGAAVFGITPWLRASRQKESQLLLAPACLFQYACTMSCPEAVGLSLSAASISYIDLPPYNGAMSG